MQQQQHASESGKALDAGKALSCASTAASSDVDSLASFATVGDLEQGSVKSEEAVATEGRPRRCGACSARVRVALFCAGLAGVLIVVAAFLLWPRDPDWHLSKIDMDTSKFIAVMTGQGNATEPLPLAADVSFWNPNFIGATTQPGAIKVFYGSEVMCHGTAGATTVGPRSTSIVRADLLVQLNEALAHDILADVMANNFQLKVSADARVVVPMGLLRVKIDAHCELTTDTLKVLSDPTAVISKSECTYSYSL